jgi:hypothetical protein
VGTRGLYWFGQNVPSPRCSCYPLFVEFTVGVTNGRERKSAPKSLWCVRLLLCVGELRSSESLFFRRVPRPPFYRSREEPWGIRREEERRKGKEESEKSRGRGSHDGVALSLSLPVEACWADRGGWGRPPTSSLCCHCGRCGMPLSICQQRPAGPIVEDRGSPHVVTLLP